MREFDLIVVGGGAAGFFGSIRAAALNPHKRILILEKGKRPLEKVRISGGGRCNVTHACFDPKELTTHYPRGQRELLGPFHRFMTGDMMEWLADRGVETKIEDDGRVFPVSNDSDSIVQCFLKEARERGITLHLSEGLTAIRQGDHGWELQTSTHQYRCEKVLFTSGSSKTSIQLLEALSCKTVPPVPSLFTFNVKDPLIDGLMGLSVPNVEISSPQSKHRSNGPVLVTHWGLSGPAVLKLSAFAARDFAACQYRFQLKIDFTAGGLPANEFIDEQRTQKGNKRALSTPYPEIPKRLWERICRSCQIEGLNWADLNKKHIQALTETLSAYRPDANGKSTFKEEFVTAGGIALEEVDFQRMEHKRLPNLFLAGEVLDIDAVTGGFNFQAAWTCAWIAGESMWNPEFS